MKVGGQTLQNVAILSRRRYYRIITRGKECPSIALHVNNYSIPDTERRITVAWHQDSSSQHSSEISPLYRPSWPLSGTSSCFVKYKMSISPDWKRTISEITKPSPQVSVSDVSQLDQVMKNIQRILACTPFPSCTRKTYVKSLIHDRSDCYDRFDFTHLM